MAYVYMQERDDGCYYIGMSNSTRKDYQGGGVRFKRSYYKDPSRWNKTVLADNLTVEQASWLEAALVGEETVADKTNFNLITGGYEKIMTPTVRKKISNSRRGQSPWNKGKTGLQNSKYKGSELPWQEKLTASALAARERNGYKQRESVTCPHCDKTGRVEGMYRWHFNNCKHKIEAVNAAREV